MPAPTVEPRSLVLDAVPGQPATGSVTIRSAPGDAGVTASIAAGGGPFAVQSVTVSEKVFQPFTEEEIEELPPFPPSIREKARQKGGAFGKQTDQSDGSTPIAVAAGAQVVVTVAFAPMAPGLASGTLVLTGQSWGRVEVPVLAAAGASLATPVVSQDQVGLVVPPAGAATPSLTLFAPPATTLLATLDGAEDVVRITDVVVRVGERHDFTDEELQEFPPFPPEIREQAAKEGWIEYHEAGRAPGGTPIAVPAGARVAVELQVAAPAAQPPDAVIGTLRILSTSWKRVEVPIQVVIADFDAVPLTDRVSVVQGIVGDPFQVALSSAAGPETDVRFAIAREGDVHVEPVTTHLPRGKRVTAPLRVTVDPNPYLGHYPLYLGSYDLGLRITAFDGLWDRQFPLRLTFLPGSVTVSALQPSIEGLQDSTAICQVQVAVSGGLKQLTFRADALPPGVQMVPLTQDVTGPATTVLQLQFVIASDALAEDEEMVTIAWDAGDGANAGAIQLPFTVRLRPESRTFSQPVITPDGTALGGHVEITLNNSGSGTFGGAMRATGFPSYKFRVRAVVRSASGKIATAQQKSGAVYGTDTPGDREFDWSENIVSDLAAGQWAEIRTASMAVSKSYEMTGVLGTLTDFAIDVVEFLVGAEVLQGLAGAVGVAGVILVGSELGALTGLRVAGPGGLAGVIVAAGATCLLGPAVMLPVLVGGVLIGDLVVRHRRMNQEEVALATRVFGDTLPVDRILLTNLSGIGGTEFTVPNVDGDILVNFGNGFDDPPRHFQPARGYTQPGQLLIHELTHAWQIAHGGKPPEYFWRAALAKLQGSSAYRYGPAGPPFGKFGLEAQATLVEQWFSGTGGKATTKILGRDQSPPVGERQDDPYFGYIQNNIRIGLD
jgi:hypothetical protein